MTRILFLVLSVFMVVILKGQDPRLSGESINITPAPLTENGTTMCVTIVNNSTTPIPYDASEPVVLTMTTKRFVPNGNLPTGSGTEYYTWAWTCSTACAPLADGSPDPSIIYTLEGVQNQEIPGVSVPGDVVGGELCWVGTAIETAAEDVTQTFGVGFKASISATSTTDIDLSPQSNNQSTYTYTEQPQPVDLSSFTAESRGVDGDLRWVTLSEENNSHFEIERSVDGRVFEKIGEVKGNGTTSDEQSYDYVDRGIGKLYSEVYYRLKQVDYDGKYERSKILVVDFERRDGEISIYPNPVRNVLTVSGELRSSYRTEIYDMLGKQVGVYDSGDIEMSAYQAGTYMVRVLDAEGSVMKVEKIVVLR